MTRRTLKDIKEIKYPEELWKLIENIPKPRAKALIAFMYVTGCRVSEALTVTKSQIVENWEPDMAIVKNLQVNKPIKGHRKLMFRPRALLPKKGSLAPFTNTILEYAKGMPDEARLFPFTRQTAWNYVRKYTGLWNHYFRSMSENYWVDIFGDAIRTGKYLDVDPRSLEPYVKVDIKPFREKILA